MIKALGKVIHALDQAGLPYLLGDESLLGLTEGNLEKYRFNIVLYQLPVSYAGLRYLKLTILLLFSGISVKPKIVHGKFRLKIRAHNGPFKKAPNFIFLTPLGEKENRFFIEERGRSCSYPSSAILPLEQITHKELSISVPHDLDNFAVEYKTELLSSTYRQHSVVFDQESAQKAEEILFAISNILNTHKSHWWLEGGTLLGLHRDGKLLDWDHDIDLGMRFESENDLKVLLKALRKTPYYVKVLDFPEKEGLWKPGNIRLFKIFPRRYYFFHTQLCLDLFIFYREPLDGIEQPVYKYVVHQRNGYHPADLLDELEDLPFKGNRLSRPKKADAFLEGKYGANWKTPVKEWHVAIDDKTILNNMEPS